MDPFVITNDPQQDFPTSVANASHGDANPMPNQDPYAVEPRRLPSDL